MAFPTFQVVRMYSQHAIARILPFFHENAPAGTSGAETCASIARHRTSVSLSTTIPPSEMESSALCVPSAKEARTVYPPFGRVSRTRSCAEKRGRTLPV